jgi:hypothetical protein
MGIQQTVLVVGVIFHLTPVQKYMKPDVSKTMYFTKNYIGSLAEEH